MLSTLELENRLASLARRDHAASAAEAVLGRLDSLLPQRAISINEFARTKRKMVNPGGKPFDYDPALTPYADGINDACDNIDVAEIYVKGNTRSAKALALDTLLPTPDGWTTMGELEVGDELLGRDGCLCRVTLTTPVMQGKQCYRVCFSDGSEIVADADHLWEVERHIFRRLTNGARKHEWKTEVLSTQDMVGRLLLSSRPIRYRFRIRNCEPLDLPARDFLIPPYILGAWLGDGTSRGAGFTYHRSDNEICEHLCQDGFYVEDRTESPGGTVSAIIRAPGTGDGICPRGHNRNELGRYAGGECVECSRLRYRGALGPRLTTMVDLLDAYGLRQNKHIPSAYLRGSVAQRLALLQGLMDTNGTCAGAAASFTSTRKALADGVFEIAASLGMKPTLRPRAASCVYKGKVRKGSAWAVSFRAYEEMPVFRLSRKIALLPKRSNGKPTDTGTRRITAIEPIESVPVRCIQVDNSDHLFLAGKAMIPTHNTVSAENMLLRDWTFGPLRNVLWLMQDKDALNDYIDERGEEMLQLHKEVSERIDWTDSRNKSRTRKRIGRSLALWRAATHQALRAKSMPVIVADEIDAYNKKVRDALSTLITSRQEEYGSAAKAYLCSHPDAGPDGGIDKMLADSLLHLWFARCPKCGHAASPAVEAEDAGKPRWKWNVPDLMGEADEMDRVAFLDMVAKKVRIVCPHDQCRAAFDHKQRLKLMNAGQWLQPHQTMNPDGSVDGVARVAKKMGFVIHAFMAPFVKLPETARDWASAKLTYDMNGSDVHLREVVVKKLGETMRGEKAEERMDSWRVVQSRLQANYPLKVVPPGVLFLTAFVDVQGDRFEVVVIGWNLARESWLIDRYAIKQHPAFGRHAAFENINPANRLADWDVIEEAVIAASYPLMSNPQRREAGQEELFLPIAKTVVNNAGNPGVTNNGRVWLSNMLTRQGGRIVQPWQVMLMQGAAQKKGETYGGKSKAVEFDDKGRALPMAVFERYPNVHEVKRIIALRMKIEEPGAPGRMYLPAELERRYWFELTSERMTNDEWVKTHKYNETWDGYVACEVGRESLRVDRPGFWSGELPIWADPKPRGQGLGSMVSAPVNVFDRLAQVNSDIE